MNSLIWHIIKKDLRRFRALLAVWCAALVTRVIAVGFVGNDAGNRMEAILIILFVLMLFLNAVMVTRVVAEDSPLKEAAFWRSRPITGRQMMTAKLIFLAGWTLVVPPLVVLAAGYVHGFTVQEGMAVAAGQLMIHALVGTLFLATSILTQRVWAAVLGVLVLLVVVQIVKGVRLTPEAASPFENASRALSCFSVAASVGLVAMGAAVTWVYRERRRLVAAVVLVAGAAGIYLASEFLRTDFLGWIPALERLEARVDPQGPGTVRPLKSNSNSSINGVNYRQLQAAIDWAGLKPGELSVPYRVEGRVDLGDGSELTQTRNVRRSTPHDLGSALQALGVENLQSHARGPNANLVTLAELSDHEMGRLDVAASKWTGRVFTAMGRMGVRARVPLKPGAWTDAGAYRIDVVEVDIQRGKLQVRIVERQPAVPNWGDGVLGTEYNTWLGHDFALINTRRKEAMLTMGGGSGGGTQDGFLKINRTQLNFSASTSGRVLEPEELAEWLADAELVKFRFHEERRVVTEATVALAETL